MSRVPHIAFFLASLGGGGIGKMRTQLMPELVNRGARIDLVLGNSHGPYYSRIDSRVNVFNLGSSHTLLCVPRLMLYLRRERPQVMVTERVRVNVAAIRARSLARVKTRIFAGVHTAMSWEIENLRPRKRRSHFAAMRRYYPKNDGFIAVSKGVAQDLVDFIHVPEQKVHVVYNPTVTSDLLRQAREPVGHPFFAGTERKPVILGVGRLEPQKDFSTLLRAFALVHQGRPCRLVLLGEGSQRSLLEGLAEDLDIAADVSLPGFVVNPSAFMANADLFVLSSAWEGSPNALTEALAVGAPVVATDCNSGPREILQGGKFGPLVPVGDVAGLAQAMQETLDNPLNSETLRLAVQGYTAEVCAENYLRALGF